MIRCNFHTHTSYCDGANTVEDMVRAAISKGFQALGFSGHSNLFFDDSYSMTEAGTIQYAAEVEAAKERYEDQIALFLGVEDDLHGHRPQFERDYTIGAAHCIRIGDYYSSVDDVESIVVEDTKRFFGGDYYRYCAAYYEGLAQVQTITHCDFIAHFDLVTKFNEGNRFFDEEDPRYLRPALETLEYLCRMGSSFEINTGAMSGGYRTVPYPSERLLRRVRELGGSIVISSDSHSVHTLDAFFPEAIALAKRCGFRTSRILTKNGWQDTPLED